MVRNRQDAANRDRGVEEAVVQNMVIRTLRGEVQMSELSLNDNIDFQVDIGRADQGRTFVRVIHLPSGNKRTLVGIGQSHPQEVALGLAKEILEEIASRDTGRE